MQNNLLTAHHEHQKSLGSPFIFIYFCNFLRFIAAAKMNESKIISVFNVLVSKKVRTISKHKQWHRYLHVLVHIRFTALVLIKSGFQINV